MRALRTGELVSHRGDHFELVDARLYTVPEDPMELLVAAGGESAARLAAELDAGLVARLPSRPSSLPTGGLAQAPGWAS